MPMTIAVDAMGGDNAPREIVQGALSVAREDAAIRIVLVGDTAQIEAELSGAGDVPANLILRHADEVIGMHEHPAQALRRKRNSSLVIAGQMVGAGEADATFSAGNTGAAMAIARPLILGASRASIGPRSRRRSRPPGDVPFSSTPERMSTARRRIYCSLRSWVPSSLEKVQRLARPSVGLLNIGAEPGKGNELTKAAYGLLEASSLDFRGNVEGKDVFEGAVDVIVCDGFAGNVLLKTGEGVAELIVALLQREVSADAHLRDALPLLAPVLRRLTQRIDYSETGGAPLLGVNGVSFIGHGRSHARAIASGIRAAASAASSGYVAAIRDTLSSLEGVA